MAFTILGQVSTLNRNDIKALLSRFASLFGARLLGALLMFLSNLLIVRVWSEDVLGLLSVLLAMNAVLALVYSAGFPSITTVLVSKYRALDADNQILGFLTRSRQVRLIGSLISFPFCLAYLNWVASFEGTNLVVLACLLSVSIYFSSALASHAATLVSYEKQIESVLPDVLVRPLLFLSGLGVVAWLGWSGAPDTLFGLFVLSNLVGVVLLSGLLAKNLSPSGAAPDFSESATWNKSAPPWVITTLVWDFFIEVQILMAAALALPAAEIAVLHICFRLRMLAGFGMRSIYSLLLPKLYAEHAKGNDTKLLMRRVQWIGTGYGVVVLVGILIAGKPVLSLFGPAFEEAFHALLLVSSVILVRGLFGPASAYLAMNDRHLSPSIVMLVCLLGSVVSAPVLISQFGMYGVAIGYAGWSSIGAIVLWVWYRYS